MNLNEANARKRTVRIKILDNNGQPLAAGFAFPAHSAKLIKPDGTIADATNNPTPLVNTLDAGMFEWQAAQAEIAAQEGPYSLQLAAVGLLGNGVAGVAQTWGIDVSLAPDTTGFVAALLATIMDPANAGNANYPANAKTFQQQWNIHFAWLCSPGDGLDGPAGSLGVPTIGEPVANPAPHRAEFTLQAGKRRWTKLDGT